MIEALQRTQGRPSVMTAANREIILDALRRGNGRYASAGVAQLSKQTLLRWLDADPDFAEAVEIAEAEAEARKLAVINKACDDGLWAPAAWWLERRRPNDYARKDQLIIEAKGTGSALDRLTPEQLARLAWPEEEEEVLEADFTVSAGHHGGLGELPEGTEADEGDA